jgi:serine/threonine-protein kinase
MDLVGQKFGNFVVVKRIGGGGMGSVYLCQHPLLGRPAALKVLHEDLALDTEVVDRFFHEAKAANDIGNEHIVDVIDFGRRDNIVYLLMELLDGESLGARQKRCPLNPFEALCVINQCCEALEASHQKGIVHRDLKPENIFLCRRGDDPLFVKLVDFGIAKLLSDPTHQQTRAGIILGTPQYMSPEQCEGKGHIDARSDIYSLGVVMFELFAGHVPFADAGVGEVMVAHMMRPTPRLPQLDRGIEAIILHATEKSPARRFQSMRELADAIADPSAHLQQYQVAPVAATVSQAAPTLSRSTLSEAAAEVVPGPPPPRHSAWEMWMMAGLAVLALVMSVGFAVAFERKPKVVRELVKVPVSEPAYFILASDPPGAEVRRGRELLGRTPLRLQAVDEEEIRIVLPTDTPSRKDRAAAGAYPRAAPAASTASSRLNP